MDNFGKFLSNTTVKRTEHVGNNDTITTEVDAIVWLTVDDCIEIRIKETGELVIRFTLIEWFRLFPPRYQQALIDLVNEGKSIEEIKEYLLGMIKNQKGGMG